MHEICVMLVCDASVLRFQIYSRSQRPQTLERERRRSIIPRLCLVWSNTRLAQQSGETFSTLVFLLGTLVFLE